MAEATVSRRSGQTFLGTKLGHQARGQQPIARERLRALIGSTPAARLILVSAPPGFGKSTFLADWLATSGARGAWLSLDRGDNDPLRFSRYLAAAADRLMSDIDGADVPFSGAVGGPFDPDLALARVLESIGCAAEQSSSDAVLVLDDYHLIDESAIHGLVASLIERLPVGARLAIATRADPPLPLARIRARGELLEVRADDLRFTVEEARSLLSDAGMELSRDEVETLTGRTEGWAAALRLAQVSLAGHDNHEDLVRRFGASHRYVLDYIVEEVLVGLPAAVHDFLLRTSILERLCGPLCEAVTGVPGGQSRLESLERANLLIVPLDDEREWYRYHSLFADILRARLLALHGDQIEELHARASAWYEAHGDDDEAIAHALRSGDSARMCRIVAEASGRYINAGELATMGRWLDALPVELVRGHAQLSASYAWYLLTTGHPEGVAERLDDAERALVGGDDGGPAMRAGLPTQLAMLRSELASMQGDVDTAIAQAQLAAALVPDGLPPAHDAILRGMAIVLLALALGRAGRLDDAVRAYEQALPNLRAGGNVMATGRAVAELVAIALGQGNADRALELCEAELARGDEPGSAARTAAVWAALATVRAALGETLAAEDAGRHALELATRTGDAPIAHAAAELLARIAPPLRPARTGQGVAGSSGPGERSVLVEPLTDREVEVLRLVALGRSNSQIAAELFVTVGTVKSHLHTISGKLGAANRVEAVARGRVAGLLD